MPSTTRGPLPPGVYWRRRLMVLTLALILVVAVGKVLSWASDGSSDETARQAGADTTPSASTQGPTRSSKSPKPDKPGAGEASNTPTSTPTPTPEPPPLPLPTGPCPDSDVLITPTVPDPVAGRDVMIILNLQAGVTEACTWQVSPDRVTLKITSGPDDIWSSRECPKVIPTQDVVVRRTVATQVPVLWNSRRSDENCSDRTAWALPGSYHAAAAALSGEPTDVQFELTAPLPETVTQTAEPKQDGKGKGKGKNKPDR